MFTMIPKLKKKKEAKQFYTLFKKKKDSWMDMCQNVKAEYLSHVITGGIHFCFCAIRHTWIFCTKRALSLY